MNFGTDGIRLADGVSQGLKGPMKRLPASWSVPLNLDHAKRSSSEAAMLELRSVRAVIQRNALAFGE